MSQQQPIDLTEFVKKELAEMVYTNMLLRAEISELRRQLQQYQEKENKEE